MRRFEFFNTNGVKLVAIQATDISIAKNIFKMRYPQWSFAYVTREYAI